MGTHSNSAIDVFGWSLGGLIGEAWFVLRDLWRSWLKLFWILTSDLAKLKNYTSTMYYFQHERMYLIQKTLGSTVGFESLKKKWEFSSGVAWNAFFLFICIFVSLPYPGPKWSIVVRSCSIWKDRRVPVSTLIPKLRDRFRELKKSRCGLSSWWHKPAAAASCFFILSYSR